MKVMKPIGMEVRKDATVPVPLSVERQAEKGMDLAQAIAERDALVDQKKQHAKADQELIDMVDERISAMAKQIREGMEDKLQRDLVFADTKALAAVAEHAGEKRDPLPSEPHAYEGKTDTCDRCGSTLLDPVHVPEAAPGGPPGDPYAFDGNEPPDPIIRSHAAVDVPHPEGGNGGAERNEVLDVPPPRVPMPDGDLKRRKVVNRKQARGRGGAGARTRAKTPARGRARA